MSVEVLAGSVVPHRGARVSMPGGDLHIPQVHACIEHRGDERVPQHVRMDVDVCQTGLLSEPM